MINEEYVAALEAANKARREEIRRLRNALDEIKVLAYEQGSKLIHDRAWEALRPRTLLQEDKK